MPHSGLKVLVLAGGPDREREVSLVSGREVAAGLRQAGHDVRVADISPDDLRALDDFEAWGGEGRGGRGGGGSGGGGRGGGGSGSRGGGDVIFPALHGPWGEGGGVQAILDARGLSYVGSRADAAARCMDKLQTKRHWTQWDMPTPPWQVVGPADAITFSPPVVLKPLCEGSSIGVAICRDAEALAAERERLAAVHQVLLVERYIVGRELTVGIIPVAAANDVAAQDAEQVLPVIEIRPATDFFDYAAKYERDDTQHHYELDLSPALLDRVRTLALASHRRLGCRDLSRVDLMIDADHQPWLIEVNTLPGFTPHSLVPEAAAKAGIDFSALVDRLVRRAAARGRVFDHPSSGTCCGGGGSDNDDAACSPAAAPC